MTKRPYAVHLNFMPKGCYVGQWVDGSWWHWGSYAKRERAERELAELLRLAPIGRTAEIRVA